MEEIAGESSGIRTIIVVHIVVQIVIVVVTTIVIVGCHCGR